MDSPKPVTSYPFLYVKPCCSFATDLMNHRKGLNILYIQDAHKCNSHDKLVYEFNRSCASGQKLLLFPQYVSLEASFLVQLLLKQTSRADTERITVHKPGTINASTGSTGTGPRTISNSLAKTKITS